MSAPLSTAFAAIARKKIDLGSGSRTIWSLPDLDRAGVGRISRLPLCLRIILESVLRNSDGELIGDPQVEALANWGPNDARVTEVPFTVSRVILQCAAGIPLLGDLTAIRSAVGALGHPADRVTPKVPVDMALDHTLSVDFQGTPDAMSRNMALDLERNRERYEFVKWAAKAYGIRVFPPGAGILHQLNLEHLAPGLGQRGDTYFPGTLVGTDSHTGMIAGLGSLGFGVGGIEALAAVLGKPVYLLMPDVIGVHVSGTPRGGVTATDIVLHATQLLRSAGVVGKFLEFFGTGLDRLTVPDRTTIANMAPEYGATVAYFPVDDQTLHYLRHTGRSERMVRATGEYYRAQGCFGAPPAGEIDFTDTIELDLSAVVPSVAGPKRPQDRVALADLGREFLRVLSMPVESGGFGRSDSLTPVRNDDPERTLIRDGDVVIAAITSCTNTSNPEVMLAAGIVAKKARGRGLKVNPRVKTSLTPGSLVVSRYLERTGLQSHLDALGFGVAGYGCATCVGASGALSTDTEAYLTEHDTVACAVLSGNRNFEARIHPLVRAAYLASPPLVVAFALAGTMAIDMDVDPIAIDPEGEPVYLRDLWPSPAELDEALLVASDPAFYRDVYAKDPLEHNPLWATVRQPDTGNFLWRNDSTYLAEPPFLAPEFRVSALRDIVGARALAIFGDSVTTDHISPISVIRTGTPAGDFLESTGVASHAFNNYGARRLNHEVMVRGTFANPRLANRMVPGIFGGFTARQPDGAVMSIHAAAADYARASVPAIVIAGKEYGSGSARDWAAKGCRLLGVRAVVAQSFERIHRSNLVCMGILPLEFPVGTNAQTLGLDGTETFSITGQVSSRLPREQVHLSIHDKSGRARIVPLTLRLDTAAEFTYATAGGILPYLLDVAVQAAEKV